MPLKAVHYPYWRCLDKSTLKRLALFFDEVWFLDPIGEANLIHLHDEGYFRTYEPSIHLRRMFDEVHCSVYQPLRKAGFVRSFNVADIVELHADVLTASTLADLSDPVFSRICDAFENSTLISDVGAWTAISTRVPNLLPALLEQRASSLWGRPELYREIKSVDGRLFYDLPFNVGAALYLNEALLAAQELGFPLITEQRVHQQLLFRKYERIQEHTQTRSTSWRSEIAPLDKLGVSILSVVHNAISEQVLNRLDVEEILFYRERLHKQRAKFLNYMTRLVSQMGAEPWTKDFEREVEILITSKILPEMQGYCDQIAELQDSAATEFVKGLSAKLTATVTTTFAASLLAGLSYGEIVSMSCVSATVAFGLSIETLLEYWKEKRKLQRNSISYLAEIQPGSAYRR